MSCPSFRKIRVCPRRDEIAGRPRRGSATLVVVLLFFVFSGLGLGLILMSQLHMKMNGWRKFSVFLDYASENGLKRGFQDLANRLRATGPVLPVSEALLANLSADPRGGLRPLLESALGTGLPLVLEESGEGMVWRSVDSCALERIESKGAYFRIRARWRIESTGWLERLRPRRISSLDAAMGILAGRLPLPSIPLLVGQGMPAAEKAAFLDANHITFLAGRGETLDPGMASPAGGIVSSDQSPVIARALNVQVLTPQNFSREVLREALGLEPSADPVPDGVYLVESDLGLGGIFVQGNLDEMVTAIRGDTQVIVFRMAAAEWVLEFSPAANRTAFKLPDGTVRAYDLIPLAIVVVDGRIGSLGGGAVGLDGRVEVVRDREIPSILNGVGLTIVCTDRITLSSHLILQGVRWLDGVPFVKDSQAQLIIWSTGRAVSGDSPREAGITVAGSAPDGLKVQASLTTTGGLFEIQGTGKSLEVAGAVHAAGYRGNGNALAIAPDERFAAGDVTENAPLASGPLLTVYSLRILAWKEHG